MQPVYHRCLRLRRMHHLFCDLSGNRSYLIFFFPLLQTGIRDLLFFLQKGVQPVVAGHASPLFVGVGSQYENDRGRTSASDINTDGLWSNGFLTTSPKRRLRTRTRERGDFIGIRLEKLGISTHRRGRSGLKTPKISDLI